MKKKIKFSSITSVQKINIPNPYCVPMKPELRFGGVAIQIKRKSYELLILKRGIVQRGPKWRQPLADRDEVLCYINLPS